MSPSSLRRFGWLLVLLVAVAYIGWTNAARIRRIDYVMSVGRETPPPTFPGAERFRYLIVPEHINNSYRWITQTETMLETGHVRVRHTTADNAPIGRQVHAASPYRWWLGAIAMLIQGSQGGSITAAVERAALYADPLLHLLLVVVTSAFVARWFGSGAAIIAIVGLTWLFPLGAGFLPGVPEDFSLLLIAALWSVLPLAHAFTSNRNPRRLPATFAFAGVIGAFGLWLSVTVQTPILVGIGLGAVLAAAAARRNAVTLPSPDLWLWWGLGGAGTTLVAYLLEYAPGHLDLREFRVVHPLYALAWLGGAELLRLLTRWIARVDPPEARTRVVTRAVVALAAVAALPAAMGYTSNLGFLNVDLLSFRLSKQTNGVLASHILEWFAHRDAALSVAATLLPLALVAVAIIGLFRRATPAEHRPGTALLLGPLVFALAFATVHLRWWQTLEALLLPLLIVTWSTLSQTKPTPFMLRWSWVGGLIAAAALGVVQLMPLNELRGRNVLSLPEVEGLVERDLAHSLARRFADPQAGIVLAPPSVSTTLHYYAGLRGLSSLSWENQAGLSVALRVVISTSREEAHALLQNRSVTHVVIPSWDTFFETYTRAASVQTGELFYNSLRRWVIPMWMRPIPHEMPKIGGFENEQVTIFELVDEQAAGVGMSRVAEYFVEMGQLDAARATAENLRRYPADFSASVARAQVEAAANDSTAFAASLETIVQRLNARGDRALPWDRRLSLAVVLARGRRADLAREQLERCLETANERLIRSLTPHALFHLLFLSKALQVEFPQSELREYALQRVPAESRARLE